MTLDDDYSKPDHMSELKASLRKIAADSPRVDEEFLAEQIETDAEVWIKNGWSPSLSSIIDAIPLLRSRPVALDAAINSVLECMIAQGMSIEESVEAMKNDMPVFAHAIDAHMALRNMLQSKPDPGTTDHDEIDLPMPFGPELDNGRKRFELVELVGKGTEGTVYRAYDRLLTADGRPMQVAIKMLHVSDAEALKAVAAESSRAMRVKHPGIASCMDCTLETGQAYLVYEFVEGLPLDRWKKVHGQISPRQAASIVEQLAHAVQAMHNVGLVHRDIKPNNIIMRHDNSPCITDFGLTKAISKTHASSGGSLAFSAPEQVVGSQGSSDTAVDVYALGGILFWLINGKYPNGQSAQEVCDRAFGNASPLEDTHSDDWAHTNPTLRKICQRALAIDPQERYASPGVLAMDLSRWLLHEPVLPYDRGTVRRVQLAMVRSPLAASVALVSIVVILGTIGLGWKMALDAQSARFALERKQLEQNIETNKLKLQEQQRRIDNARNMLQGFIEAYQSSQNASDDAASFPVYSAIESIGTSNGLDITSIENSMVSSRIAIIRNMLDKAEKEHTRNTIEMTLWETGLGYWLIKDQQYDEAERVLTRNVQRLESILKYDDPWLVLAKALKDIATIHAHEKTDQAKAALDRLNNHLSDVPEPVRRLALPLTQ